MTRVSFFPTVIHRGFSEKSCPGVTNPTQEILLILVAGKVYLDEDESFFLSFGDDAFFHGTDFDTRYILSEEQLRKNNRLGTTMDKPIYPDMKSNLKLDFEGATDDYIIAATVVSAYQLQNTNNTTYADEAIVTISGYENYCGPLKAGRNNFPAARERVYFFLYTGVRKSEASDFTLFFIKTVFTERMYT